MKAFKPAFLLIFILLIVSGYAQSDFRSGYIITNNNDTVYGKISYNDFNIFNSCIFINNSHSKKQEFAPFDIVGFRFIDGKFYISKEVKVDNEVRKYFVEYLIKGKSNVYFLREVNMDHYYIDISGDSLIELTQKKEIIKREEGSLYVKPNFFHGRMKILFKDYPQLFEDIDKVKLEHEPLISFAKKYNTEICNDSSCTVFEKKIKTKQFKIGLFFGQSVNSFDFGGVLKSDYGLNSYGGIRFEINNLLDFSEHVSLKSDLTLQHFSTYNLACNSFSTIYYEGKYYELRKKNDYYDYSKLQVNINSYALKIPIVISKSTSPSKFGFSYGIGIMNYIFLYQSKDFYIDYFKKNIGKTFQNYQIGMMGELGMYYIHKNGGKTFFDLNFEFTDGLNMNQTLRIKNIMPSAKIGYVF